MKTSLRGISAMLAEEAVVLTAYNDGTGTLTIGAGHTAAAGPPSPQPGMTISLTEAINVFRNDLAKTEREVLAAVRTPLSPHQFDALVSWHFNTGAISTATLTRKLNAGDAAGAAGEFARWNKSKGKVLAGLVERRKRETAMFAEAKYGNPRIRVMEALGGDEEVFTADQIEVLLGGTAVAEEDQSTEELLANPISQLLPRYRPKQSSATTRATIAKFADLVPEDRRRDAVSVVAVRGYYLNTMGKEGANDRNLYDDAIFVIEPDGVHNFNGNTDPSRFSRGIAKLKSRQAIRYRPGPHGFARKGGPYPAFRQDSNCTVIRDQTGEDTDTPQRRFWINLHRGGNTTTSSLGCQTVPPHQWNEFKTLVDGLLRKYDQETFYYLLVDQEDVPKEDTIVTTPVSPSKPVTAEPTLADALPHLLALLALLRGRPAPQAPAPTPIVAGSDGAGLSDEVRRLQELLRLLTGGAPPVVAEVEPPDPHPLPRPKPVVPERDPLVSKADPALTPVNGALGKTIGEALDGRKTAIGIIGLLATTVLPIFFPQLAPITAAVGPVVEAIGTVGGAVTTVTTDAPAQGGLVGTLMAAATPVFAALTGWGVLGKVEKWVRVFRPR